MTFLNRSLFFLRLIFVVAIASLIFNWFSIWALISAIIAWAFIALIK